MAKPTYRQAQDALLDHLEREGWRVSRHLKVPHATSRGRDGVRIWFKPQALWYSCGPDSVGVHSLSNARSLWVDVREASPEAVERAALEACTAPTASGFSSRDPDLPVGPTHYYCSRTRAGGKKLCWPVRVIRYGDFTHVRGLAGRFAGRSFSTVPSEITRYVPTGYVMAPGTKTYAPPASGSTTARRDPPTKTTWVLQTNYGYGQGWKDGEEFTSAEKGEKALQRANRSKYSSFPHRLVVKGSERHRNRGARDPGWDPAFGRSSLSQQIAEHIARKYVNEGKADATRLARDYGISSSQAERIRSLISYADDHDEGWLASQIHLVLTVRSGRDREPPSTRRGLLGRPPASQRGSTPAGEAQLADMTYQLHRAGYTRAPRQIAVALRERGVSPAELAFRLQAGELTPTQSGPGRDRSFGGISRPWIVEGPVAAEAAARTPKDKKFVATLTRRGKPTQTFYSATVAGAIDQVNRSFGVDPRTGRPLTTKLPEYNAARAEVHTDTMSIGSYHGIGGGRRVADLEKGQWLVDMGPGRDPASRPDSVGVSRLEESRGRRRPGHGSWCSTKCSCRCAHRGRKSRRGR